MFASGIFSFLNSTFSGVSCSAVACVAPTPPPAVNAEGSGELSRVGPGPATVDSPRCPVLCCRAQLLLSLRGKSKRQQQIRR
jgi:hypothetical protein